MKICSLVLAFLCIGSITLCWAQGNGVANGGGFARCADQKYYAYDYLITMELQEFGEHHLVADVRSNLLHISSELKRMKDPLALEFDLFLELMFTQKAGAKYQWFKRTNLTLMWEPGLEEILPVSCRQRKQAVYFTAPFLGMPYSAYDYDPQFISQVLSQENGPLQVSYLWVHEWLWNFFPRVDFMKLATFNRLLHSKRLSAMTIGEFVKHRPTF